MEKLFANKWLTRILIVVAIIASVTLIFITKNDSSTIKKHLFDQNTEIEIKLDSVTNKIEKLRKENLTNEEVLTIREDVYNFKQEVEKKHQIQENEIESMFIKTLINWSWIFGVFGTALALLGIEINTFRIINSKVEGLVNQKIEHIENVFESEVWLSDLRKTTKILAVYKKDSNFDEGLNTILDLTKLNYSKVQLEQLRYDDLKNKLNGVNAVIIEHANLKDGDSWEIEELKLYLKTFSEQLVGNGIAVFYYNSASDPNMKYLFPTLGKRNYLTSFSNSESQVYPNLKNLLIVQKLLIDQGKLKLTS
ncbi:MAG: hypothetical protein LCH67_00465 [Bacteroidetes bacterium]|nr:hypothetical protein [Bacteroidota bacterium]